MTLRQSKVNQLLAFEMPVEEIEEILTRLGLEIVERGEGTWTFAVPSYRFDISIEVDLIEELARVYGYNNLPVKVPTAELNIIADDESKLDLHDVRRQLVARGYQEAITYSFIEKNLAAQFDDQHEAVALANPISAEMAVMRTTIMPGLAKALQYNQNRQQGRVRLFETGQRFIPNGDELIQENVIAGIISGPRLAEGWASDAAPVDFYDLKGDVESILALGGSPEAFSFVAARHVALHPGQSAAIQRNGETVGYLGALHPELVKSLGLNGAVFVFEINQASVLDGKLPRFDSLSKFPETRRDLALLVDEKIDFESVREIARQQGGEFLKSVTLFDVYQGKGVEPGQKSLALGLTWQHPSRTLNDEEINEVIDFVVSELQKQYGATLRE